MAKKTLIINGSPRVKGNTAFLIEQLKKQLEGEIVEISAFRDNIAPCVDCRACWKTAQCVIKDKMQKIYDDDFDNFVIASPVYYSTLPGAVLSVMSRLQPYHAAKYFLKQPKELKNKKASAILTGGGMGDMEPAFFHLKMFFGITGAKGFREHTVMSKKTDTVPAWEDKQAVDGINDIAHWLNEN